MTTLGSAFAPGALANGVTGANLAMPSITEGTTDAPVLYRRLYRTTAGGSTFYWVADIDNSTTSYLDGKPDSDLEEVAPTTNTSGSTGAVTLTINGVAATEVASTATPTAGQFKVDYSRNSSTAGTVTHAAADVGLSVVATYIAANLLTMTMLNNIITGIKSIVTAFGTPGAANGTAMLDGSSRLTATATAGGLAINGTLQTTSNLRVVAAGQVSISSGEAPGTVHTVTNSAIKGNANTAIVMTANCGAIPNWWPYVQGQSVGSFTFCLQTKDGSNTNAAGAASWMALDFA